MGFYFLLYISSFTSLSSALLWAFYFYFSILHEPMAHVSCLSRAGSACYSSAPSSLCKNWGKGTCGSSLHVYPYSQHIEAHCQASFGDREQESFHGKADTTIAGQVRFRRGMAKKKGEPRELATPQLGNLAARSNRFGRELWGKVVLPSPTQPCLGLVLAQHLACPWLGPRLGQDGCQGGHGLSRAPLPAPTSALPPSSSSRLVSSALSFRPHPCRFGMIPFPPFSPLIPFCFLPPILLPNPVPLP